MSNERLSAAAQEGDINLLYTLIQEESDVLDHMDSTTFVDTPLHVAASAGHLQFATEIMRLKPSFAWKLNKQGFTPIHLALQHGHNRMVLRLVHINKNLVRAKGREGITPLHFVTQIGKVDLLVDFLLLCPDSIQDVTVRSETVLHIAVKYHQHEALQVLVGWLKVNDNKGAMYLEETILSWKDETGNTILHVAALTNNLQALQLLVKTKIDLDSKNLENQTALDIIEREEMKHILERAGAKRDSQVNENALTFVDKLKSKKITILDKIIIFILRIRKDLTEDQRNAFLVVAALVATATYQSALSPPGGVYQANSSDNSIKFMATTPRGNTGRSVMAGGDFFALSLINTLSFLVSTVVIFILTPSGKVRRIVFAPIFWFANCYLYSMSVISPNNASTFAYYFLLFLLNFFALAVYFSFPIVYKRLWDPANRKIITKNSTEGNVW